MGPLTIPTTLSTCITACHNHHPKGCQDSGGESGQRDSWAGPGTHQAVDKVPTWQGQLAEGGIYAVLQSLPRCLTLSSGWGLREAENGHRLPTEACLSLPSPRGIQGSPCPGYPCTIWENTLWGRQCPPTRPSSMPLGRADRTPPHTSQHPVIPIQALTADKCWVPGVRGMKMPSTQTKGRGSSAKSPVRPETCHPLGWVEMLQKWVLGSTGRLHPEQGLDGAP